MYNDKTRFNEASITVFIINTFKTYMWCTPTKQGTSDILGKMSFWYHCEVYSFSFNLIQKSSSYSSYFSSYDHLCLRLKQFLWKCEFEKSAFRVSYSYSFGYDRLQKNVWKSVRNNMEVIENILGLQKKKKIS